MCEGLGRGRVWYREDWKVRRGQHLNLPSEEQTVKSGEKRGEATSRWVSWYLKSLDFFRRQRGAMEGFRQKETVRGTFHKGP